MLKEKKEKPDATITFYIKPSLKKLVKEKADSQYLKVSQFICLLIRQALDIK